MRSTLHGPEAFLVKSKKPHIQHYIQQLAQLSESDIDALPEKPDVKKGLLALKKKQSQSVALARAEQLADLMTARHHPELK